MWHSEWARPPGIMRRSAGSMRAIPALLGTAMKVGTFGGIPVYIHWSFWLLIAAYFFPAVMSGGLGAALYAVAFILAIFFCVVLHEFGHATAAAMYGIPTADITLLPIGGVARLRRMPDNPLHELVIALAGPAVNVVIAGALLVPWMFGVAVGRAAPGVGIGTDFIEQLIAANIFLVVFNLLPAFPMDGGRVLRGFLAMRMGQYRATQIAARVGRWMALGFAILSLVSGHLILLLIAAFIFFAGTAELLNVRMREIARQQQAAQAMWGTRPSWYQHVWPQQGSYYAWDDMAAPTQDPDVIDVDYEVLDNGPPRRL
ncbi:MAG: site-2 protease family protein [Planctomycetota bacterium]|nr:MAG: site-2 protease family protein [Planctomycetota bacterium]